MPFTSFDVPNVGGVRAVSRLPVVRRSWRWSLATAAAFFVTQHLKVTTPLLAGYPRPVPEVIDPYGAGACGGIHHSSMKVSFYLQHRSDTVDVYIVDASGDDRAHARHGRPHAWRSAPQRGYFRWNGREDNGSIAPDGTYYVRVALLHQGRTIEISNPAGPEPIKVLTVPPHPVVTSVSPSLIPLGHTPVTIKYKGTEGRSGIHHALPDRPPRWPRHLSRSSRRSGAARRRRGTGSSRASPRRPGRTSSASV